MKVQINKNSQKRYVTLNLNKKYSYKKDLNKSSVLMISIK